ncbi:Organic solvent tolerance protein [Gemmata sp. SH-PL17]|uniref:LPS assembly protein LptD n=1 Tax=Gemmata sp. SH-PL17 TaxID=1630693 RepID=UPI00078D1400|nr:LPS assembly protein LptD [Gemmata sp. SH-PL17]AMV28159.1 Organic solvent tolerance protein [Gemmata sp. SH-PL17]
MKGHRVFSGRAIIWAGLVISALLASAPATRAQPVPPVRPTVRFPDDPAAGTFSLPTDGLMSPVQPVPPRTAYQPPRDTGSPYEPDPLPNGAVIPTPQSKKRYGKVMPRYAATTYNADKVKLEDGTERILFTGGVIINISSEDGDQTTEFATDEAVMWLRNKTQDEKDGFATGGDGQTEVEVYLSGNVIVRTTKGDKDKKKPAVTQTLRAVQVYYDATQNRAVALRADLEMALPSVPDAFHLRGEEVRRLDLENWEILNGTSNASKLPSDPGLRLDSQRFTLSQRRIVLRNIFGFPIRDIRTGEPIEGQEQIVTGTNVVTRLGGLPVFYLPKMRFDATDPLGPVTGLGFSQNRIFGSQFYSSFDIYELLALRPPPGHSWRLNLDYLSRRGLAGGTDYTYRLPAPQLGEYPIGAGLIKLYGLQDDGLDILGGPRGTEPAQPSFRGRALWRHQQEVMEGTYFQGQFAYLSDKNFLEQYYKNEFDMGPNQETFAYLTWQRRNFGASALVQDRLNREWVSTTNWLPRVDGHLLGQTFLDDLFVYSARASAGYAQARPTEIPPFALLPTERRVDTGRFDLWQELSVPFALGPVKLAPYGVLDLTEYTSDINGNEVGRVYGGGGTRASLPFSRLYGDVSSELLNLRGLNHKVVFGGNYLYARSNEPYTRFPMLDRLNDDAVDQAYRNIRPIQSQLVPGADGLALMNSPIFNPQLYAIRRLVENRTDTLDSMNVLQMDVRQRFQTKRGYPGMEHTVDFLTFDVSASYFPDAKRDNFGNPFSFLEYGTVWNLGDRTSLVSNGWFEPYEGGSRYWNAGVYVNRTDRTNVYLGYRQTDPINSKAVVLTMGYQMSPRYYMNLGASYDFGLQQALSNTFTLTRTGADLTVTVGFTYNAFVNNFGFQFLVIPNLASALGGRFAGTPISNQQLNSRR